MESNDLVQKLQAMELVEKRETFWRRTLPRFLQNIGVGNPTNKAIIIYSTCPESTLLKQMK